MAMEHLTHKYVRLFMCAIMETIARTTKYQHIDAKTGWLGRKRASDRK